MTETAGVEVQENDKLKSVTIVGKSVLPQAPMPQQQNQQ
jgi:hypothetical protein